MRIRLAVAACAMVAAVGCGTAVYEHRFEVVINDPSGRLGAGPVDVSVFDKGMGYSEEWARRTMGVATAAKPYAGSVSATATKTIFDTSLPQDVVAGLAIPAFEKNGYFLLDLRPVRGSPQTAALPFTPYGSYFPEGNQVQPLPVRYEAEPASKGWQIRLTVEVPPRPSPGVPQ